MSESPIGRQSVVRKGGAEAGLLEELPSGGFRFTYTEGYRGPPISLTMPLTTPVWEWDSFPPFFDGLLPEGPQLEALLRIHKLDRADAFGQLLAVGLDLVGDVLVERKVADTACPAA